MEEEKGFVYIITNSSMPGYIKIGSTDNLEERLRSLDNTSTPWPFEPFFTIKTKKYKKLEKIIHSKFEDKRVRPNREFFEVDPKIVVSFIRLLSELLDDAEINEYGSEPIDDYENNGQIHKKSRATTFEMLNIPIGSFLEPIDDRFPRVVTVDNKNTVRLDNGEEKAISRAAGDAVGYAINGFGCYKFDGVVLYKKRLEIDENYWPAMQDRI